MNRKAFIIAITAGALSLTSGCTRQQIADAIALHQQQAVAPAAEVAGPTTTASADCQTFNFTVSGYPEGTDVFVEIGSEPPRGFTVGGSDGGFTAVAGGATGTIAIPAFWTTQKFNAIIEMTVDGNNVRAFEQDVDCTPIEG